MKIIFTLLLTGLCAGACAEVLTLKDGTKVEGTIEGEMDGVMLLKTQYGALNIKRSDIASPAAPAVSTSPAEGELPQAELPAQPAREPKRTFTTITPSTSSFERTYYENGVAIATETLDARGELLGLQGFIKDGTYREYYASGGLKTEKTVINAEIAGVLKAYYPNGVLQSEAAYSAGVLNGPVRFYGDNAKLLFEQSFKNGVSNGWFREYDAAGALKSELFYANGQVAERPKTTEALKPAAAEAAPQDRAHEGLLAVEDEPDPAARDQARERAEESDGFGFVHILVGVGWLSVTTVQSSMTRTLLISGSFWISANASGEGALSRLSTVNALPPMLSRFMLMLAMLILCLPISVPR